MASNLFSKAKKSAPEKTTKAKEMKTRIRVEGDDFFNNVSKLAELNDTMKSAKAKADIISDELRDIAKEEWVKLYDKTGKNPGSVMIEGVNEVDDTAQFMYVPSDKYISINSERAEELVDSYGEEIVEEKTTYSFDDAMIEKYGEVLSRMIEESTEISERDKEKIIKAVTTYSIAKGTIDSFTKYGEVGELMETTRPVVSLKNIELIKA
jgi:hypothetical protein